MRGQDSKPPCPENRPGDVEIEDIEDFEAETGDQNLQIGPNADAGPSRVGKHSTADLGKLMAGIPAKSDWSEMKRSGLNAVVEKCAEHWGRLGGTSQERATLPLRNKRKLILLSGPVTAGSQSWSWSWLL